jgi:hypothetical protein
VTDIQFLGFIGIVSAGGIMLALMLGFLDTERTGAGRTHRAEVGPTIQPAATLPAFFARPQTGNYAPDRAGLDDALIAYLEEHVRAERAIVTGFVHLPSFASLYRQTGASGIVH